MRRWCAATAAVVTVLAVAGCGVDLPRGTDGDITDEWRPVAAPAMFVPEAGKCHEKLEAEVSMDSDRPVPCAALHVTETVAIGALVKRGGAAPTAVPVHGDQYELDAYRDCTQRVTTFLGGPWRTGRVEVNVVLPTQAGWSGGARWYRCDVTEINIDTGRPVARTDSMAGGLAGSQPLLLRCFNPKVKGDFVDTMTAVGCTKPHKAEFAGLWAAPAGWSYAKLRKDQKATEKGCLTVIARFATIPDDSDTRYRVGWISYHPTADEWDRGVRDVQCFLWKSGAAMTRSMKGAGTKALPINYA